MEGWTRREAWERMGVMPKFVVEDRMVRVPTKLELLARAMVSHLTEDEASVLWDHLTISEDIWALLDEIDLAVLRRYPEMKDRP